MLSSVRRFGAGTLLAVTLVSCGGDGEGKVALNPTGPIDAEQLLQLLPDEIVSAYDTVSYDEATGETKFSNLRFSSAEEPDVGIVIKDLSLSGLDTEFLLARLNGTNFEDGAMILNTLEANEISLFGTEKFYNGFLEAYTSTIEDLAEDLETDIEGELEAAFAASEIQKLDYTIANIFIENLELRPFILNLIELEDEADTEFVNALQTLAAYYRGAGASRMSMSDMRFDMAMLEAGETITMVFDVPSLLIEGWSGGDFANYIIGGMVFDMAMPVPEEDADDFPFEAIEMTGDYGRQTATDVRLDKALGWLARGEMPPTTETDLMSLGIWTADKQTFKLFDTPFYSVGSSRIDLSDFHWLMPTNMTFEMEDFSFDIGSFVETMFEAVPELQDDPEMAQFRTALAVLKDYDLAAPSMDADFSWNWDEATGASSLTLETGLDGYGTMTFDLSGLVGDFNDWVSFSEDSEKDTDPSAALEAFANRELALGGFGLAMADRGGNDRLYKMLVSLGGVLKDENPEWAALAAYDEETMKLLVSSSVIGGAELLASELPAIRDYAKSLADYLTKGGTFTMAFRPDEPVSGKTLQKLSSLESPAEVTAFLEQLGFEVTYQE